MLSLGPCLPWILLRTMKLPSHLKVHGVAVCRTQMEVKLKQFPRKYLGFIGLHPIFSQYKSISTLGQKGRLSKCALKGSKHALNFFRVALPHRYLHTGSSTRIILEKLSGILPDSQKWHDSLDRKWMRPRNVGAARATLTREDSEWSRKFEKPWQSRPRDWRGVEQFLLQGRVKGLAKSLQRGRVEML